MKTLLTVVDGSVKVVQGDNKPKDTLPTEAPYKATLEGGFGIGSASEPKRPANGTFVLEALEHQVDILVYEEATDPSGRVASSTKNHKMTLLVGKPEEFRTHESNAYTVEAKDKGEAAKKLLLRDEARGKESMG